MTPDSQPAGVVDVERLILRALCSRSAEEEDWAGLQRELAGYVWLEPDHAVIYEAIKRARSRDRKNWRAELPAQATRMGFPDLDWATYLSEAETPQLNLRDLVLRLRAGASGA